VNYTKANKAGARCGASALYGLRSEFCLPTTIKLNAVFEILASNSRDGITGTERQVLPDELETQVKLEECV